MSVFTWTPEFGISKNTKPNVRAVKFGDGYESRQAFGINNLEQSWQLAFAARDNDEADDIEDFLDARAGVESFTWTPPYESDPIKVVCREWSRVPERANMSTISATFERVYEP